MTAIFNQILSLGDSIEGITLSGGEPLDQIDAVTALLGRIRGETDLSVLLFTGYEWDEITLMPGSDELLACADVVIAGRYDKTRCLASGLRGSSNQTFHFLTNRYNMDDLSPVPSGEVVITEDGQILITGIDPPVIDIVS